MASLVEALTIMYSSVAIEAPVVHNGKTRLIRTLCSTSACIHCHCCLLA